MKLFRIEGNRQRLDGGAMFGNCPRVVWEKWCPPDEQHRIDLACRALLVREPSGRNVLLEAGIGVFFEPKMRSRFGVTEPHHVLIASLAEVGLAPSDIDVVILSHMHFDHAGGLLTAFEEGKGLELVFPKATYVIGKTAWERACHPHSRDKASFIPELQKLIEATGRLVLVDGERCAFLGDAYRFYFSEGHTPGLMLTRVSGGPEGDVTFMGDLVPGTPWVHLPITMGYDRYPEKLIDEKEALLAEVAGDGSWLYYTHDPLTCASRVKREAGKFIAIDGKASTLQPWA